MSSLRNESGYEFYVSLLIMFTELDGSPNEITAILGITPSATRNKGDTIGKTIMKHKHSFWELESGIERRNSLFDDHISALEAKLRPAQNKFQLLPKNLYIELSCGLFFRSETYPYPAIHLSSDSLSFFASIGAEIDIDIR